MFTEEQLQTELRRRQLQDELQKRTSTQTVGMYGQNTQLADPMAQSLSPIPSGQSVLPDPMANKSEEGSSFELGKYGKWTKQPGLVNSINMIGDGAAAGAAAYTATLLKFVGGPASQGLMTAINKYASEKTETNKKMYPDSWLPVTGEVTGELAATAPAGGPLFKGVIKGAEWLASKVPMGLKTATKYGSAYLGGQQAGGLLSGLKQDPENPDTIFNIPAYQQASDSILSGVATGAGVKLSAWADKARYHNKIEQLLGKYAIPRDFTGYAANELGDLKYSAARKAAHLVLDAPAALTGMGERVKQMSDLLPGLWQFAMKIAGRPDEIMSSGQLVDSVAKQLTQTMQKMKAHSNKLWDKGGFKQVPIKDIKEVKDIIGDALEALNKSGIPGSGTAKNKLEKLTAAVTPETTTVVKSNVLDPKGKPFEQIVVTPAKGQFTVDDVKNIQSMLSKGIKKGRTEGGLASEFADELQLIKDKLEEPIQKSLSGEQLKNFTTAKTFYKNYKQTQENIPLLTKGIIDEKASRDLIRKVLNENEQTYDDRVMGLLPKGAKNELLAAKLIESLEKAKDGRGSLDLNAFTKTLDFGRNTQNIANPKATFFGNTATSKKVPPTIKTIEGMKMYLQSVQEAEGVGWWRQGTIGAGLAGAAAGGGITMGPFGAAAALISYPAMIWIANHPYLKRAVGALTSGLSDSVYKHLMDKIGSTIARSGYIIDPEDKTLKHVKEKALSPFIRKNNE